MICIKCNERIPIISNLDFQSGTISLYCQCNNENEIYNIREYNTKLNEIKQISKDVSIKNQVCFIHKNNDIELFCCDCVKEFCRECDLKKHLKENHQILKLLTFYDMITSNLNYMNNIQNLQFFESFNIKFINDIINLIELAFKSFVSQKNKIKINFTPLKNICYIELRLSDCETNKSFASIKTNQNLEKKEKYKSISKYQFGIKINSLRKYINIRNICLKNDTIFPSFLNVLMIPNSYYCALVTSNSKLLILKIENNSKKLNVKIEFELELDSKFYSSMYKLSLINENIFALLYNSGSFDLFFLKERKDTNKIELLRKKYISLEKSTNIINQIQKSKDDNFIIVLIKDQINFYKYNENEIITLVKQIDRNDINLILPLDFHNSILTLYNSQEIIIKDVTQNNNYIINIKERQVNIILEIKSFNYLAIAHFDSDIDIFDLNLMLMKNKLKGHKKIVNDLKEIIPLENSNYNAKLVSCSDDKTIRIWNLIKFYCEYVISLENNNFLFSLNVLPNREIMALDSENIIYLID